MGRIKVQKNTNVITFDFYSDLLTLDRLYNICCVFNLNEIYLDIYSAYNHKKDLNELIANSKLVSRIFCVQRKHLQDIHMKLTVEDLPVVVQLLADFNFEGLNIWDCYDIWENYIKNISEPIPFFNFKHNKVQVKSGFYLDYIPDEGQRVTIICDIKYYNQDIQRRLTACIKNN